MKNQILKQLVCFATGLTMVFSGIMPALADGSAKLYFSPATKTVAPSTEFNLQVRVDTGADSTVGVDTMINFDADKLEYVGYDNTSSDFSLVIETTKDGDGNSTLSAGRVVLSGLVFNSSPKSGDLLVATAKFKTKSTLGSAELSFEFDTANPDKTAGDSNVAPAPSSAKIDLLASVQGATITIASVPAGSPTITSINPSSGTNTSTHSVVISGTNFDAIQGTGWVHIGTKSATVTSWSDTSITVTIPAEPDLTQNSPRRITVTRDDDASAVYDSFTYIVGGAPVPPPPSGNMYITYIYPASGSKMTPNEVTIYGSGFGQYTADSKVYIGLQELTAILDWNDDRILVQVPPRPELTSKATLTVKVYNTGDSAEYLGYTYLMSPLPGTGPEHWMWAGIIAVALAGSWLVYRKLNKPVEVVDEYSDYQF